MEITRENLLLVVAFTDSLCIGLVLPILAPHIMMHSGNHVMTGILAAGSFACVLLSHSVTATFDQSLGKKTTIVLSLMITFISYLTLMLTTSYPIILLTRYLACLTSKTDVLCKRLMSTLVPEECCLKYNNVIDILTVTGMVLGPIVGGYVFECKNSISYNAGIACFLTLANIMMVDQLEEDSDKPIVSTAALEQAVENCKQKVKDLKEFNYRQHWHVITLIVVYISCMTIYFLKFTFLIKAHYEVGTVVIGYTIAYQNMLIFFANCFVPSMKNYYGDYIPRYVFEDCLVVCAVTLMGLYFAPCYECYLILFIPMVLTRTVVSNLWNDSLGLDLESNKKLKDVSNTLTDIIQMVIPLVFGYIADIFQAQAFKVLNLLPIAVCVYILFRRYREKGQISTNEDPKED